MDAQTAAERRVLGREAMLPQRPKDRVELRLADAPPCIGTPGNQCGGVIETIESPVSTVSIDPGDTESAERRGLVPPAMNCCSASTTDRNVVKTGQDTVFRRKNCQGERLGIHQNPGLFPGCKRNCGRHKEGGEQNGDQTTLQPSKLYAMKQISPPAPAATARRPHILHVFVLLACFVATQGWGATFPLPNDGSNIVGQLRVVTADPRNTLLDIARHYELGYDEITAANHGVSVWLPGEGTRIVVATLFILPPKPWQGLVVNIPQRRLYYFPKAKANEPVTVVTYPIGIARPGWPTPLGQTTITSKYRDPSWTVPDSILEEHRSQGEPDFPGFFPPGPDNPLGMVAFRTGFAAILLHGTNRPWGVGMRVSHGCIRLYPENSEDLFLQVPVGTPLRIINQPAAVGNKDGVLYLSVAEPVEDYSGDGGLLFQQAIDGLLPYDSLQNAPEMDLDRVQQAVEARLFVPVPVSVGAPSLEQIIASIDPERYDFEPYGIEANNAMTPEPPRPSGTSDQADGNPEGPPLNLRIETTIPGQGPAD